MEENTIKAAKIAAVGAVAAALVGGGVLLLKPDDRPADLNIGENCGVIQGNNNSCNNLPGEQYPSTGQRPVGPGPWPFITTNTWGEDVDKGVVVRPCEKRDCGCPPGPSCRLGVAKGNTTVYVECRRLSDYNGDAQSTDGRAFEPLWYKIKWPNDKLTATRTFTSSVNDRYSGWILAAFAAPQGHNGEVPACA